MASEKTIQQKCPSCGTKFHRKILPVATRLPHDVVVEFDNLSDTGNHDVVKTEKKRKPRKPKESRGVKWIVKIEKFVEKSSRGSKNHSGHKYFLWIIRVIVPPVFHTNRSGQNWIKNHSGYKKFLQIVCVKFRQVPHTNRSGHQEFFADCYA